LNNEYAHHFLKCFDAVYQQLKTDRK